MYNRRGEEPPLTEIEAGQYLLDALFEVGPVSQDGMGNWRPISWTDLQAYASLTGAIGERWEMHTVMRMSKAYLKGISDKEPLSIPPCLREEE